MTTKYEVTISRSAYENITLEVVADDADNAEDIVSNLIEKHQRDFLDRLPKEVKYLSADVTGDEESIWEVVACD